MDSIEIEKNPTLAKLQEYKKRGFVFHGSPNPDIKILEPRPSREVDPKRTFNLDTAVFADKNFISPIVFSLVDRNKFRELHGDYTWYIYWDKETNLPTAKIPAKWKDSVTSAKGIVYVLPGDTFVYEEGSQKKSRVEVTPSDRVEVTLNDYLEAGGKIIFE